MMPALGSRHRAWHMAGRGVLGYQWVRQEEPNGIRESQEHCLEVTSVPSPASGDRQQEASCTPSLLCASLRLLSTHCLSMEEHVYSL